MRRLLKRCESCKRVFAHFEACVLSDVTFKKSAEGGIRCKGCAPAGAGVRGRQSS